MLKPSPALLVAVSRRRLLPFEAAERENPDAVFESATQSVSLLFDDTVRNPKTFDVAIVADRNGEKVVGPAAHRLIREGKARAKFEHAGDELLGNVIDETGVKKFISGHIHRAAYTTDRKGVPIPNGHFSRELFGNPGPAKAGRYGVVTYRDDGMAALHSKSVAKRRRSRR